jgi:hypothetical protein
MSEIIEAIVPFLCKKGRMPIQLLNVFYFSFTSTQNARC